MKSALPLPVTALAIALALAATPSLAQAGTDDRWELGIRVGGMITDTAFRLDGSAEVLTLTRSLTPKRAIELEVGADQLDFGIDYGLRHRTVTVNYLEINPEPLWDPYFLIGVGVSEFDVPATISEGRDPMLQLGTGGSWELIESGALKLRGDLRFRYDLNDTDQPGQDGWGDAIFTLGLSYRF